MRIVMVEYADDVDISTIPKGSEISIIDPGEGAIDGGTVIGIIDAVDPPEGGIPGGPVGITITGIAEVSDPPA